MLSQQTLSPLVDIEAKITSRVAKFLSMKEVLIKLTRNLSVTVRDKAQSLLAVQKYLEGQLSEALKKIENLKAGSWTFSDITSLGVFYKSMEDHIRNVSELQKKAGLVAPTQDISRYTPYIVLGIGGILLLKLLKVI